RLPGGVDVGGWDEFGSSIRSEPNLPVAVVNQPMMVPAQGDGVVQIRRAAVYPGDDVVNVRPPWWSVAAGERAAAIASQHGLSGGAGVGATAAADINRCPGAIQHDRQDPRAACQAPHRVGW